MVEDELELRVATSDRITNDEYVDVVGQAVGRISVVQLNACIVKLSTHRWVNLGVRTSYLETEFAREQRDARHESTADTDNIYFQIKQAPWTLLEKPDHQGLVNQKITKRNQGRWQGVDMESLFKYLRHHGQVPEDNNQIKIESGAVWFIKIRYQKPVNGNNGDADDYIHTE